MKLMFFMVTFALFGLSVGKMDVSSRGCITVDGKCVECEVGTHLYKIGVNCDPWQPEATCDNPTPLRVATYVICDYSACYCDPPTVRDTATNKCVPLEECTKEN